MTKIIIIAIFDCLSWMTWAYEASVNSVFHTNTVIISCIIQSLEQPSYTESEEKGEKLTFDEALATEINI